MSVQNRSRQRILREMEEHREHPEQPGRGQEECLGRCVLNQKRVIDREMLGPWIERKCGLLRFTVMEERERESKGEERKVGARRRMCVLGGGLQKIIYLY